VRISKLRFEISDLKVEILNYSFARLRTSQRAF
jgi:hypothetical protein